MADVTKAQRDRYLYVLSLLVGQKAEATLLDETKVRSAPPPPPLVLPGTRRAVGPPVAPARS